MGSVTRCSRGREYGVNFRCSEKQVETPKILAPSTCSYQHEAYGVSYTLALLTILSRWRLDS